MRGMPSYLPNCTYLLLSPSPFHFSSQTLSRGRMVMMGIGRMVVSLKSKLRSLKTMKKDYDKVEKSESMRVEIRSRKARKLIERTLKIADSPTSKTFAF
ncbi:uncharacterized protein LOC120153825 [Hibiscus syriacus]|nr:uncharacterized protein LOC120153825 [Hibiscus syriacus]